MLAAPVTKPKQSVNRHITLDEFWKIPEGPPNFEFEDGELISMVSPTSNHQDILSALLVVLRPYVMQKKLGRIWPEVDVHLPNLNRVYIPDLVFLSAEKLGVD